MLGGSFGHRRLYLSCAGSKHAILCTNSCNSSKRSALLEKVGKTSLVLKDFYAYPLRTGNEMFQFHEVFFDLGLCGGLGLHQILEWTAIVNKTCKTLWNNQDTCVHIMNTSFAMSA